jgi:hypothetical protein
MITRMIQTPPTEATKAIVNTLGVFVSMPHKVQLDVTQSPHHKAGAIAVTKQASLYIKGRLIMSSFPVPFLRITSFRNSTSHQHQSLADCNVPCHADSPGVTSPSHAVSRPILAFLPSIHNMVISA